MGLVQVAEAFRARFKEVLDRKGHDRAAMKALGKAASAYVTADNAMFARLGGGK